MRPSQFNNTTLWKKTKRNKNWNKKHRAVISLISAHSKDVHHVHAFISRAPMPTQAQARSTRHNRAKRQVSALKALVQHCKAHHCNVRLTARATIIIMKAATAAHKTKAATVAHSKVVMAAHKTKAATVVHSKVVMVAHSKVDMVAHKTKAVTVVHSKAATVAHSKVDMVAHSKAATVAHSKAATVAHSKAVMVAHSKAVTVVHSKASVSTPQATTQMQNTA